MKTSPSFKLTHFDEQLEKNKTTMYLFTVCTHNDGWYDALVVSAKRGGYIMKTLGWQCKWGGFVWRLGLMMDAMSNLREDDIVCFTDAYDVIMLVSAPELESRYRLLVDNGGVLISVDNPTREAVVDQIVGAIFGNCVGDKTVNAGAYMGTVAGLRTFLHLVQKVAHNRGEGDDQMVINSLCRHITKDLLTVDTRGDIFFHTACANGVVGFVSGTCPFGLDRNLVNPLTDRRPGVLHAPAGLNLDHVCEYLGLPMGKRRHRWKWFAYNYGWHMAIGITLCIILIALITVVICHFFRSHPPTPP